MGKGCMQVGKALCYMLAVLLASTLIACAQKADTWREQYDLGVRYLRDGNYEEAVIAFTAAIEIDPKRAEAYVGRGDAYIGSGGTEENLAMALRDYEKALEIDERNVAAYLGAADVYIRENNYAKARETLERGLEKISDQTLSDKLKEIREFEEETSTGEKLSNILWTGKTYSYNGFYTAFEYSEEGKKIQCTRYHNDGSQINKEIYDCERENDNYIFSADNQQHDKTVIQFDGKTIVQETGFYDGVIEYVYYYDENGRNTKADFYNWYDENGKGSITSRHLYYYYENNNLSRDEMFSENGKLFYTIDYAENGKPQYAVQYRDNGTRMQEEIWKPGKSYTKTYRENGTLESITEFEDTEEDSRPIKRSRFNEDETVNSYDVIYWDAEGNYLGEKTYDAEGNFLQDRAG